MIKDERQRKIREQLAASGTIAVRELACHLNVSEMTIRRDLDELADAGVLERVHGGAHAATKNADATLARELSHAEKRLQNAGAKQKIARMAASLVQDGETVFLGAGTTIEQMVGQLPACQLRIVTNSLGVFNLLEGRSDYELCLVGGLYRQRTAAFVGPMAEDAVASLGIDCAFVGVNGIASGQASTANMEEGRIQALVLDKAQRRYLVADASKLGRRDFYSFYPLANATALICDATISEAARAELSEQTRLIVT